MIIRNRKTKGRATDRVIVVHVKGNVEWIDDFAAHQPSRHFVLSPSEPISRDRMSIALQMLSDEFGLKPPAPKKPK
jgi:hypothetical protein